jgi:hypothetical protein
MYMHAHMHMQLAPCTSFVASVASRACTHPFLAARWVTFFGMHIMHICTLATYPYGAQVPVVPTTPAFCRVRPQGGEDHPAISPLEGHRSTCCMQLTILCASHTYVLFFVSKTPAFCLVRLQGGESHSLAFPRSRHSSRAADKQYYSHQVLIMFWCMHVNCSW